MMLNGKGNYAQLLPFVKRVCFRVPAAITEGCIGLASMYVVL